MKSRGHEVCVTALERKEDTALAPHDRRFPVRNIYRPDGASSHGTVTKLLWHGVDIWNPRAAWDFRKVLKEFQPDVVSCHNLAGWSIAVWNEAQRRDIPIVHVLHDYYLMCTAGSMSKDGLPCTQRCARCKAFRLPHRGKSAAVSGVVAISEHMKTVFETAGYFPNARIDRIYNVEKPPAASALAPQALPAPDAFGFIGRVAPHKGVEVLLEAFARADLPETARLDIAGTGTEAYVAGLRARYASPRIRFLGHTSPAAFFSGVSWTVAPSLSNEPLGRVIFESIGHGVPVIASRRGGIPEMVDEGRTGHLVPPGDVLALRAALEKAARQPMPLDRKTMAATVATFFDTDRFLDEYENMYSFVTDTQTA